MENQHTSDRLSSQKSYCSMTEHEFRLFRTLIYRESGINVKSSKREYLEGKIGRRLKALKINSFKEYYDFVTQPGEGELSRMLNCICTHETHFFRDSRQFEFLENQLFPTWKAKAASGLIPKTIRVWSAGCSTGEEPYSLAMVLNAHFPAASGWHVDILASDLSTDILERAEKGIWSFEKTKEIPERFLKICMLKGRGSQEGKIKAGPGISSMIRFERINLNDPSYPVAGRFEMIFCRNVLIYFDQESKKNVIRRLLDRLSPEGYLFLGNSETLNSATEQVISVIPAVYISPPRIKIRSVF